MEMPFLGSINIPESPYWLYSNLKDFSENFNLESWKESSIESSFDYLSLMKGEKEDLTLLEGPVKEGNLTYYRLAITLKYYEDMKAKIDSF